MPQRVVPATLILVAISTPVAPQLAVPTLADLTIKTLETFDAPDSGVITRA